MADDNHGFEAAIQVVRRVMIEEMEEQRMRLQKSTMAAPFVELQKFKDGLGTAAKAELVCVEFKEMKQTGTIQEYINEFENSIDSTLPESHQISSFLSGLKHEIKHSIRMFKPLNLYQAYTLARLQESSNESSSKLHLNTLPNTTNNPPLHPPAPNPYTIITPTHSFTFNPTSILTTNNLSTHNQSNTMHPTTTNTHNHKTIEASKNSTKTTSLIFINDQFPDINNPRIIPSPNNQHSMDLTLNPILSIPSTVTKPMTPLLKIQNLIYHGTKTSKTQWHQKAHSQKASPYQPHDHSELQPTQAQNYAQIDPIPRCKQKALKTERDFAIDLLKLNTLSYAVIIANGGSIFEETREELEFKSLVPSGEIYRKLFGITRNTMKTDIINFLKGLEKASRSQWELLNSYGGKTLSLQGLLQNALLEDVERILCGCEYVASSINMFNRGFLDPVQMATVISSYQKDGVHTDDIARCSKNDYKEARPLSFKNNSLLFEKPSFPFGKQRTTFSSVKIQEWGNLWSIMPISAIPVQEDKNHEGGANNRRETMQYEVKELTSAFYLDLSLHLKFLAHSSLHIYYNSTTTEVKDSRWNLDINEVGIKVACDGRVAKIALVVNPGKKCFVGNRSEEISEVERLVCVSGGSSFIALWLIKLWFQHGCTIKTTVHDPDDPKEIQHLKILHRAKERLHLFKVDLLEEGAFDLVVDGCEVFYQETKLWYTLFKRLTENAVRGSWKVILGFERNMKFQQELYLVGAYFRTPGDFSLDVAILALFHISLKKNLVPYPNLTSSLPAIHMDKELNPVAILDQKLVKRANTVVLTSWRDRATADCSRIPNHTLRTRDFDEDGNEMGKSWFLDVVVRLGKEDNISPTCGIMLLLDGEIPGDDEKTDVRWRDLNNPLWSRDFGEGGNAMGENEKLGFLGLREEEGSSVQLGSVACVEMKNRDVVVRGSEGKVRENSGVYGSSGPGLGQAMGFSPFSMSHLHLYVNKPWREI